MNIRQLRYFLAVAQELNFTRAAERVGIAQPALSQQIIGLEQELGAALFTRENRRVALTAAGDILIDHAHRVLNAAAEAVDAVHLAERGALSSLSVGAVYSSLYSFLPGVLRTFANNNPRVELKLQEMTISQQISALCEGIIEIGLLRGPIHHRELATEILYRERMIIAVPAGSDWASQSDIANLRAIAKLPLVAVQRQAHRSYSDRVFELFEAENLQPTIAHYAQDMHTALCLVAAGFGVSVVPAGVRLLQTSGIVFCPIDEPSAVVTFALAMRNTPRSKMLEEFIAAARLRAEEMLATSPDLFLPR